MMLGGLFIKALGNGIYKVSDGMFGPLFPLVNLPALVEIMEDFRVDHEKALTKWAGVPPFAPYIPKKQTIMLEDLDL